MPPKPSLGSDEDFNPPAPKPALTEEQQELAEDYGWTVAVFRSSPELWRLFNRAVKEQWTNEQFVAKLRDTKWFKKHSDVWRKNAILELTDPGTYAKNLNQALANLQDMAVQLSGNQLGAGTAQQIAKKILAYGWNDSQIRNALANYVTQIKGSGGGYGGEAGAAEEELAAYAADMGVTLAPGTVKKWLKSIVAQKSTVQGYKAYIQGMAKSAYGGLAPYINEGKTVKELADPYMQLMGDIWEENPAALDFKKNPMLLSALGAKNKDGTPGLMSLGDFRLKLKADPKYLKTKAARDDATDIGHQILQDFGLI